MFPHFIIRWRKQGTKSITGQNYAAWQSIVKANFAPVASLQVEGIDEFYIFLLSDDQLEQLFGVLCLLISSQREFTILQLVGRLSAAYQVLQRCNLCCPYPSLHCPPSHV